MSEGSQQFDPLDDALRALQQGKLVIVVDAEERENEGDFVCAAEKITPELVHFMLKNGMGELCVALLRETADRLSLVPIVDSDRNTSPNRTAFLTPVDHRESGSGVSPASRARTIRAMSDPRSTAQDFVRPGHIHPLLAKEGGVLRRAGHTEATVDLLRMAGLTPVGALIEICSADGQGMASFAELQNLARQHHIPLVSIEQIIKARRLSERLIHREVEVVIPTRRFGEVKVIGYSVLYEDQQPVALVWGEPATVPAPLVRMHSSCFTGDLLDSLRCDCGDQLHLAMDMIAREGTGVVVYLPQEGRGIGLMAKLKAYKLQDEGYDTVEANHKLGFKADSRDYGIGLQILKDLGLSAVRLLTNNPRKIHAFPGFDLHLVEQVPIIAPPEQLRENYLATKRDKLGHLLPSPAASHPRTMPQ
ncbi:MAG: GTP cyclohydrolase-2 [Planctomycetaceae bacterium]|nr:MAG: GTP cyclohydrolase-2 [Planctomycetaceae bacterium]